MANSNLEFARGGAEFTVELIEKLKAAGGKENVLISPFSIQACMALAFSGAKGDTANEIATAMKFNSNSPNEVAENFQHVLEKYQDSNLLKMASKVYVQKGNIIKPEYAASTKEHYHAEAETVDFCESEAAAQAINSWVENKTSGKISDLVAADSLDANTRLVLLNALHFKGEWQEKFDETITEMGEFWIDEEKSVEVQFMRQTAEFKSGYLDYLDAKALEMPYKDSDLSMFVLMPYSKDGLLSLADKLKNVNLLDLPNRLYMEDIVVEFPKFKIDYSVEMSEVLKEMGIQTAFSAQADFSNMLNSPEDLCISDVFHKTSIEVNEEGSEAAAVTGFKFVSYCAPPEFIADHPFFYWIWNNENILFAGAFVNPPTEV